METLFAQADALEAQYESLKAKIEKLPQALLGKAFRGELVPQDPTNEPASVLLQKIKAETAKGGKKKEKKTIRLNWCFSEGGAAAKSLNQFIKIKSPMEFQR
ncbi:hypothetical protein [Runella sp.]|uniref:hypothetical protein n=1 Tax=Runella sp. TaxID=1960881 RepID=UPI003D1066C2